MIWDIEGSIQGRPTILPCVLNNLNFIIRFLDIYNNIQQTFLYTFKIHYFFITFRRHTRTQIKNFHFKNRLKNTENSENVPE